MNKYLIAALVAFLLFVLFYKPREMYVETNLLDVNHTRENPSDIKKRLTRKD